MSASCRNRSMGKWRKLNDWVIHSRICCTSRRKKKGFSGFLRLADFLGVPECRGYPAQKNPRCVLIKWLCPVSVGPKSTLRATTRSTSLVQRELHVTYKNDVHDVISSFARPDEYTVFWFCWETASRAVSVFSAFAFSNSGDMLM